MTSHFKRSLHRKGAYWEGAVERNRIEIEEEYDKGLESNKCCPHEAHRYSRTIAVSSSKRTAKLQQTTRRRISEDTYHHSYSGQNIKVSRPVVSVGTNACGRPPWAGIAPRTKMHTSGYTDHTP